MLSASDSDLQRLRCALAGSLCIKAATIPADRLDFGVAAQQFHTSLHAAIFEDFDNCAPFEINDDGSVSLRFALAPIVDADDSWQRGGVLRMVLQLPKHRVIADFDIQTVQEPLGRPPTCCMPKTTDNPPTREVKRANGRAIEGIWSEKVRRGQAETKHRQRQT